MAMRAHATTQRRSDAMNMHARDTRAARTTIGEYDGREANTRRGCNTIRCVTALPQPVK